MSNVKISELAEALNVNIIPETDVIIINDGSTTKKIKVDEFLVAAGTAISGNLIPVTAGDDTTSSFDLGSPSAAWRELYVSTASINFVDAAGVITKFTKDDVTNLKSGKSLRTDSKQIVNELDDTTFVRMGVAGKAFHIASNTTLIKLQTSSFDLGDATVPVTLIGTTIAITGSTSNTGSFDNSGSFNNEGSSSFTGSFEVSGSTVVSGSFTVTDLLTVLADYGQTGSFGVSGSSTFQGDVNMDGAVNVNDLLTVLAGFGASGSNSITGSLVIDGGGIGERSLVITGSTDISGSFIGEGTGSFTGSFGNSGSFENTGSFVATGSFNVNNLLDLLANYGQTGIPTGSGEGGVAEGDINLDGQVNVNDLLLVLAGYGNPNIIATNQTVPPNVNHQFIGPTISINTGITLSISTGSFVSITS